MAKLVWDEVSKRFYETGVQQAALFVQDANGSYPKGVAWNGFTGLTESPSGAEATPHYADNIQYLNLVSLEKFGGTIEAFTYPPEFGECNGASELTAGVSVGQQSRKAFGLCYKTFLGNDVLGTDYGYKLHLVYGALVAPSEKAYKTINDSPEAMTMSWTFTTTPVPVTGFKPTACLIIDSKSVDANKLAAFEKIIYGDTAVEPSLPLPDAVKTALEIAG